MSASTWSTECSCGCGTLLTVDTAIEDFQDQTFVCKPCAEVLAVQRMEAMAKHFNMSKDFYKPRGMGFVHLHPFHPEAARFLDEADEGEDHTAKCWEHGYCICDA